MVKWLQEQGLCLLLFVHKDRQHNKKERLSLIRFIKGDMFKSGAEVLVCPVNCVGSMGGGLAKKFADKSEHLTREYQNACSRGTITPGSVTVMTSELRCPSDAEIWLLATKDNWRSPSQLEWIDNGLQELAEKVEESDIQSVALPAIGCGLGGLRWRDVCYLIRRYFEYLDERQEFTLLVFEPSANGPARRRGAPWPPRKP